MQAARLRIIFLVALIVALGLPGSHAKAAENVIHTFYAGGISVGFNVLDVSDLNDKLQESDVSDLLPITPVIGLYGYGLIRERALLGGTAYVYQQRGGGDDINATMYGWYGLVNAGYVAWESRSILLVPVLGVGWSSHYLQFTGDMEKLNVFDAEDRQGKRDLLVSQGAMLTKIGFDFYYLLPFHHRYFDFGAFPLGAHIGYLLPPLTSDWYDEKGDRYLKGGPDMDMNSFYLAISFGFGGGSLHTKAAP